MRTVLHGRISKEEQMRHWLVRFRWLLAITTAACGAHSTGPQGDAGGDQHTSVDGGHSAAGSGANQIAASGAGGDQRTDGGRGAAGNSAVGGASGRANADGGRSAAGSGGTNAAGATATAGMDATAIPCTNAEWTQDCGAQCRFDAAAIDCKTACMNLTAVCGTGCPSCMGMNLDQPACMIGCATYRSVTCFNRLLGCFMTNDTCGSVTTCANVMP
jgi:hypothetical protein